MSQSIQVGDVAATILDTSVAATLPYPATDWQQVISNYAALLSNPEPAAISAHRRFVYELSDLLESNIVAAWSMIGETMDDMGINFLNPGRKEDNFFLSKTSGITIEEGKYFRFPTGLGQRINTRVDPYNLSSFNTSGFAIQSPDYLGNSGDGFLFSASDAGVIANNNPVAYYPRPEGTSNDYTKIHGQFINYPTLDGPGIRMLYKTADEKINVKTELGENSISGGGTEYSLAWDLQDDMPKYTLFSRPTDTFRIGMFMIFQDLDAESAARVWVSFNKLKNALGK